MVVPQKFHYVLDEINGGSAEWVMLRNDGQPISFLSGED